MKYFIRTIEYGIDSITASSLLIHAIMLVAAVASYGNIVSYLSAGHTNTITAQALSTVLGAVLVIASSRLTKLNLARFRQDRNLQGVVVIAVVTGMVSGYLQALEYNKHYGMLAAYMLGFGIPLLLEVAPALSVALLKNIDASERTNALRRNMAEKINDSIAVALEDISPEHIRKRIEYATQLFAKEFVDNVAGEMLYELRESNMHTLSAMMQPETPSATQPEDKPKSQPKTQPTQLEAPQLDDKDTSILQAVAKGAYTPYAISKETGITITTLKRNQDGNEIGRLPKLVAAGHLSNGDGKYRHAGTNGHTKESA